MFCPIISSDDMTSGFHSMGNVLAKLYDINTTTQCDWITYANEHFGRLYSMIDDLRKKLKIIEQQSTPGMQPIS